MSQRTGNLRKKAANAVPVKTGISKEKRKTWTTYDQISTIPNF